MTVAGVLFDLDGTLVDTAPDLVAVLNDLLRERELAPMPYAIARNEVSNGAMGLIRLAFGNALPADESASLRSRFLEIYGRNPCTKSRIFNSLDSLIVDLHKEVRWGIVTNKPHAMTMPLLEQLGLAARTGCVVSGDRLPERKPHPAPLLLAADELGLTPANCVYVGDAARDIEAGRAAGMHTLAALWGYIRPGENPASWAADALVRHPADLAGILRALLQRDFR